MILPVILVKGKALHVLLAKQLRRYPTSKQACVLPPVVNNQSLSIMSAKLVLNHVKLALLITQPAQLVWQGISMELNVLKNVPQDQCLM